MRKKTSNIRKHIFFNQAQWFIQASFILALLCPTFFAQAQESWTLGKCIDHALEYNLTLNISYNEVESGEVSLKESKIQLYPNLNFSSDLNYSFGRAIAGDNTVTFEPTYSNYYSLNSSFTLFQGLVKRNNIKYQDFLLKAKMAAVEIEKNQLITRILGDYYSVIYSKGIAAVAESQLSLSTQQYNRMLKLVKIGKESPIAAQDLKSQMAADQLALTKAQNQLKMSLLQLKQLLRLNASQDFNIQGIKENDFLIISKYKIDDVFTHAENTSPQMKQQAFLMESSERDLKMAKGRAYPSLRLIAGFNSAFYSTSNLNFMKQLENNQRQWIAASINVPIFNQYQSRSNIKRKRIELRSQKLRFEIQKEALYTEIWTAIEDLESAEKEYKSSEQLYEFSELNLKNVTKKLDKGLANTTEFETAKQRFISAKANLLKAKMIYIMRSDMLEFYQTSKWEHLY